MAVGSGATFADALTAGPAAAALGGVMVLAQTDTLGAATGWLQQQRDDVGFLRVVGGPSAVSPGVQAELEAILG